MPAGGITVGENSRILCIPYFGEHGWDVWIYASTTERMIMEMNAKEIKVEEINEMLKNMLTLGQYVELLQLMIKECEIFMDNNGRGYSGLDN